MSLITFGIIPPTSVVNLHKKNGIRPEYDLYIGRAVLGTEFRADSWWANPNLSLEKYERYIRAKLKAAPNRIQELVGKRLGCWCITTRQYTPPLHCHGQILLKLVAEYLQKT